MYEEFHAVQPAVQLHDEKSKEKVLVGFILFCLVLLVVQGEQAVIIIFTNKTEL